jgi:UDP-N-acetyl-2-amino-2-deoxyglucuronate dehydrogenase
MSESFGLAVVGCGQIVTHHLEAISSRLQKKIILRALCDPSAERRNAIASLPASRKLIEDDEPKQYNALDELIGDSEFFASSIDIIFIAVPHDLHETLALQALGQNMIVVLEKPLAPTLSSCNKLVAASENLVSSQRQQQQSETTSSNKGGRPSMLIIAEQSPYWESVALARKMIGDGAIGRVVTAAAYYYESMRDNITSGSVDSSGGLGWRGSIARAGGGIGIDGGLHWIRPLREMVGRIDEVVAVTRHGLAPELGMEGESLGHAILKIQPSETTDGPLTQPVGSGCLTATYSCNMLATAPMAHDMCPYFRVTGTKGELVIGGDGLAKEKPGAGGLRLYDESNPNGTDMLPKDRVGGFFLGFSGLWSEVHRICVDMDYDKAHETVVRAADDVRTVLAMYKSSESGRWESTQV